ncbi:MAG: hypothetical protein CL808_00890 [Citromicrobium sp.]|nr:hypothetical protein [Citromicrobium sp.]
MLPAAGLGGLLALGVAGAIMLAPAERPQTIEGERFGLMTSLPIYRAPQASVADALSPQTGEPHWLRQAVEQGNSLAALDLLDPASLAGVDILLLIQPRALTPAENVALDDWVRGGGKVLLVADPMLTSEPRFALGDPRNPQAIAVTGPIQARWGLELEAPGGSGIHGDDAERQVRIGDREIPVVLGGRFALRSPAGGDPADCALRYEGLVAVCSIGAGRAVLLADATLFERGSRAADASEAFWALLGTIGDGSGS